MDVTEEAERRQVSQARVVFGLIVMIVGALMLADRFEWWGVRVNVPIWPWFLIVLGLARFADQSRPDAKNCTGGRRTGAWLIFVGAWGLLNEYRLLGAHYGHSWPLLLIGAGVFVVWRSLDAAPPRDEQRLNHD